MHHLPAYSQTIEEPVDPPMTERCEEVISMLEIGLSVEAASQAVREMSLDDATRACLDAQELPEAMVAAIKGAPPPATPIDTPTVTPPRQSSDAEHSAPDSSVGFSPAPTTSTTVERWRSPRDGVDRQALRQLYSLPDPATAVGLSGFVGFGAGHFYSGRPDRGFVFLGLQAALLGGMVGTASNATTGIDGGASPAPWLLGAGWLLVRSVDVVLAPGSARASALEQLDAR